MEEGILTRREAEDVMAAMEIIKAAKKKIQGEQLCVYDTALQEHCRVVIAMTEEKEAVS